MEFQDFFVQSQFKVTVRGRERRTKPEGVMTAVNLLIYARDAF